MALVTLSGCESIHIMWCIAMFSDAHCKQLQTQVENMKHVKTDLEDEVEFTTGKLNQAQSSLAR